MKILRLRIKNDNGIERLYVEKSVRISPTKVTTQNIEKLGRVDDLMSSMNLSRNEVIEWAQNHVDELNGSEKPIIILCLQQKRLSLMSSVHLRADIFFFRTSTTL